MISQPSSPYSKNNLTIEVKAQYGFLLSHHLELEKFNAHFPAVEISILKDTWGKRRWEEAYGYPSYGVSFWYSDLGGFKAIGSAIAFYPTINFPLVSFDGQSLNFKLGVGAAYLTNHFDRIDNYQNFAIGSAFNLSASLFFDYKWQVTKRSKVSLGLGLTHFSNGSTKTPNYGLNIFTAALGYNVYLSAPNSAKHNKLLPRYYPFEFDGSQYLELQFSMAMATKDMTEQLGERFSVYAFYTNILARVSYKSKIGAGVDYTYDTSDGFELENSMGRTPTAYEITKVGVNVAYELVIDRMSFLFNFGMNVAGKERGEGDVYQRLTLKYRFSENWFGNMALSSHLGKAEYIGLGVGRRLFIKYRQKVAHD